MIEVANIADAVPVRIEVGIALALQIGELREAGRNDGDERMKAVRLFTGGVRGFQNLALNPTKAERPGSGKPKECS